MGHFSAGQFVPRAFLQVNAVLIPEKEKEKIKRGRGLSLNVGPAQCLMMLQGPGTRSQP